MKIISLFFACSLWFFVLSSQPVEVEKKVSVKIVTPKNYAVSNLVAEEVLVKIRGARAYINAVINDNQLLVFDLKQPRYKKKRKIKLKIVPSLFNLPFGAEFVEVKPDNIVVKLDRIIYKKVSVKAVFQDKVRDDHRLLRFQPVPKSVMIQGPKSVMRNISKISTRPIEMSSLIGEGEVKVALDLQDPRIKLKKGIVPEVVFQYRIKPKKSNLKLDQVRIRFLTSKRQFKTSQEFAALSVLVPDASTFNLEKVVVQVVADIPEGQQGLVKVKLRAVLPENIHLLQIHPQYINVRVK